MTRLIALLPIFMLLEGCLAMTTTRPQQKCDYNALEEDKIQAAVNAAHRWQVPTALVLGLLEPHGPPWVKPRELDWDEFRMDSENWSSDPDDLDDSAHFLAWFSDQSQRRIQLDHDQTKAHYLAIRLGQGAYHRQETDIPVGLITAAHEAEQRAKQWQQRMQRCPINVNASVSGGSLWKIWN